MIATETGLDTKQRFDTKQRILDSAERLFAERGFAATSLRTIIADAKVNLAAIHYHYRSKQALLDAVILRRLGPINRERLEMLDACERGAVNGRPALEGILEAFFSPAFRIQPDTQGGKIFVRLIGRILSEDASIWSQMIKQHFGGILERFLRSFSAALPELPASEILWRMHFMAGALAQALRSCGQDLRVLHGGLMDTSDVEGTLRRLVAFSAAGFRAP